jgi:hypothetical protein
VRFSRTVVASVASASLRSKHSCRATLQADPGSNSRKTSVSNTAWEFERARREGQRLVSGCLILNWRFSDDQKTSRLGVVTSKKNRQRGGPLKGKAIAP